MATTKKAAKPYQYEHSIEPNPFRYALGLEAEDIVTGFSGHITGRVQFLTGCAQYVLTPKLKNPDSEIKDHQFDENRIVITGPGVKVVGGNTPQPEGVSSKPGGSGKKVSSVNKTLRQTR